MSHEAAKSVISRKRNRKIKPKPNRRNKEKIEQLKKEDKKGINELYDKHPKRYFEKNKAELVETSFQVTFLMSCRNA